MPTFEREPVIQYPCALEIAFTHIAATGHKKPELSIAGYTFKRAPDHGRNKGAIYVTAAVAGSADDYLGKIINGLFIAACITDPVMLDTIYAIMKNPQYEAIKWGRETGECAVCGRHLDNKESVALGIGPICNERMGWTLPAQYRATDAEIGEL